MKVHEITISYTLLQATSKKLLPDSDPPFHYKQTSRSVSFHEELVLNLQRFNFTFHTIALEAGLKRLPPFHKHTNTWII
jgi:hypothetical protein